MLLEAPQSQLVLIDYQSRLMPAMLESGTILANAVHLAQAARLMAVPVWGTEQNPSGLGETDPQLRSLCQDVLAKMHFSAVEEGLSDWLRPEPPEPKGNARSLPKHLQKAVPQTPQRNMVVIAGCEAHICLLQTALDLIEEEFEVWVVTDACSSRTERNRDAAFDRLAGVGAELVTTEMVLFEWVRSAEHPQFKALHALVK